MRRCLLEPTLCSPSPSCCCTPRPQKVYLNSPTLPKWLLKSWASWGAPSKGSWDSETRFTVCWWWGTGWFRLAACSRYWHYSRRALGRSASGFLRSLGNKSKTPPPIGLGLCQTCPVRCVRACFLPSLIYRRPRGLGFEIGRWGCTWELRSQHFWESLCRVDRDTSGSPAQSLLYLPERCGRFYWLVARKISGCKESR